MVRKIYELSTEELIYQFTLVEEALVNQRECLSLNSPKEISNYQLYMNDADGWDRYFIEEDAIRNLKGRVDSSVIKCYLKLLKNRAL